MKVIDLLNKIANGEITKLHKFKWNGEVWEEYSKFEEINNEKSYKQHRQNGISFMRFEYICDASNFNKEIEIIEEDKEMEKGIKPFGEYWEEIEMAGCDTNEAKIVYLDRLSKLVIELREAVNELKKGK